MTNLTSELQSGIHFTFLDVEDCSEVDETGLGVMDDFDDGSFLILNDSLDGSWFDTYPQY